MPQTLSEKQQGAPKEEGDRSPFVLLAAWDCVPQTPTEEDEEGPSFQKPHGDTECETIDAHGSMRSSVFLSARASKPPPACLAAVLGGPSEVLLCALWASLGFGLAPLHSFFLGSRMVDGIGLMRFAVGLLVPTSFSLFCSVSAFVFLYLYVCLFSLVVRPAVRASHTVARLCALLLASEPDGVLHILVLLRASAKPSQDFVLTVEAPNALTPLSMEQSIDVVMPPSKP